VSGSRPAGTSWGPCGDLTFSIQELFDSCTGYAERVLLQQDDSVDVWSSPWRVIDGLQYQRATIRN
jgi:hypothetical protein